RRSNCHQTGSGGEVEYPPAGDEIGMVEDVASERLAAGPGKGPERRRQAHLAEILLGLLPQSHRLVCEPPPDFRRVRHGVDHSLSENEGSGVETGGHCLILAHSVRPAQLATYPSSSR